MPEKKNQIPITMNLKVMAIKSIQPMNLSFSKNIIQGKSNQKYID